MRPLKEYWGWIAAAAFVGGFWAGDEFGRQSACSHMLDKPVDRIEYADGKCALKAEKGFSE